ncbi:MAG: helix-turn-helix transcriptional regulator [Bacteroidales bacterium]|nr:helix-turn-helix transcriptional regulator [Bacteroidales bacterium]
MNTRLQQFLSAENITQSQFADNIGVARASISHILAGRNKPGFDFIESLARHYPTLNIDWFITGNGKMYKSASEPAPVAVPAATKPAEPEDILFPFPDENIERNTSRKQVQNTANKKVISKITVFFTDGTFEDYTNN